MLFWIVCLYYYLLLLFIFVCCLHPLVCFLVFCAGTNSSCVEGHTGRLCGVCESGYGMFGTTCVECPPTWASVLVLLLIVAVIVLFYVGIFFASKGESKVSCFVSCCVFI